MSSPTRTSSLQAQGVSPGNTQNTRRWWRLRRSRTTVDTLAPAVEEPLGEQESWCVTILKLCEQASACLPALSASTKKSIIWLVAVVVVWKLIIWALELVVTGLCFVLAISILLCFSKPDYAVWFLTEILPPYVEIVRCWLGGFFSRTGQMLNSRPFGTSSLALPAPPATPESSPTTSTPTRRSNMTTATRVHP